jgi:hypothetical protein
MAKPGPHCVMSSAIGHDVLTALGLTARPVPVQLDIANDAWMQWAHDGYVGGVEAQLARGAHLLTNRPGWQGGTLPSGNPVTHAPWDGHLVLEVDDPDRVGVQWLLDLDLAAFRRPAKGILLPDVMVARLNADRMVVGTLAHASGATASVCYKPLVADYADDWRTAKDWAERHRFADLVRGLVLLVRGLVERDEKTSKKDRARA